MTDLPQGCLQIGDKKPHFLTSILMLFRVTSSGFMAHLHSYSVHSIFKGKHYGEGEAKALGFNNIFELKIWTIFLNYSTLNSLWLKIFSNNSNC